MRLMMFMPAGKEKINESVTIEYMTLVAMDIDDNEVSNMRMRSVKEFCRQNRVAFQGSIEFQKLMDLNLEKEPAIVFEHTENGWTQKEISS